MNYPGPYRPKRNASTAGFTFGPSRVMLSKRPRFSSRTRTTTRRTRTNRLGVTAQRDYQVQYIRKSAPKRLKRKLRRSYKKFTSQMLKSIGSNIVVKNNELSNETNGTSVVQGYIGVHLFGASGTDFATIENGTNDMSSIFATDTRLATTSSKAIISSGILDITIRCQEFNDIGEPTAPIELDIYEIMFTDETRQTNFYSAFVNAQTTTTNTPGYANGLTLQGLRGVTLFDFPYLTQLTGMKIQKKTKVFLPKGSNTTYQIRDPGNFTMTKEDVADTVGFIKPYKTKMLALVWKPIVGNSTAKTSVKVGATRRYNYKILEANAKYDGVLP